MISDLLLEVPNGKCVSVSKKMKNSVTDAIVFQVVH